MSEKVSVTLLHNCYVEDVLHAVGDDVECSQETAAILVRDGNGEVCGGATSAEGEGPEVQPPVQLRTTAQLLENSTTVITEGA